MQRPPRLHRPHCPPRSAEICRDLLRSAAASSWGGAHCLLSSRAELACGARVLSVAASTYHLRRHPRLSSYRGTALPGSSFTCIRTSALHLHLHPHLRAQPAPKHPPASASLCFTSIPPAPPSSTSIRTSTSMRTSALARLSGMARRHCAPLLTTYPYLSRICRPARAELNAPHVCMAV